MAILQVPATDLAAQWREIADEVEPVVLALLRSGNYLGQEAVEAFEAEFAAYVGGGVHAVACSSGTDAVELMVRATTEPNARVDVPSETFVATLAAVERSGRTIGAPRDARIAVWLYGSTANADAISRLCAEEGSMLLEDASQAHGNKLAGTIGTAAAWSLYPSKNLGGIGQGGVVTFKHRIHADKARLIREHGYERATDRHVMRGFNMRLDGVNADCLRVKLRHLDAWVARKREIAKRYISGLRKVALLSGADAPMAIGFECEYKVSVGDVQVEPDHCFHQFVIRVANRDAVLSYLRSVGIGAMVHYRTTADGRETEWSRSVLSLPCHAHMSDEQVEYVIEHVKRAVRGGA